MLLFLQSQIFPNRKCRSSLVALARLELPNLYDDYNFTLEAIDGSGEGRTGLETKEQASQRMLRYNSYDKTLGKKTKKKKMKNKNAAAFPIPQRVSILFFSTTRSAALVSIPWQQPKLQ